MVKVIHLINILGHPNQPYMSNLFNELVREQKDVKHTVFCSRNLDKRWSDKSIQPKTKFSLLNFKVFMFVIKHTFFSKTLSSYIQTLGTKPKIKFLLKWYELLIEQPDVVHVHNLHMAPKPLLAILKSKGVKLITSLRGRDLVVETMDLEKRKRFLNKIAYLKKVHVNSDFLQKLAIERGVDQEKLIRIYRGMNVSNFKPEDNNTMIYNNHEQLKIIVTGRLQWEKGHVYLLESLFRLKEQGINLKCDIYGEGQSREFLEYRITQLGLNDIVSLKGYTKNSELIKTFKKYHVAVQPSLYESFSNGLMELCFHNVPCVVSNIGGMPELIKHGVNGLLFNINAPQELDQAILQCVQLDRRVLNTYNESLHDKFSFYNGVVKLNSLYKSIAKA